MSVEYIAHHESRSHTTYVTLSITLPYILYLRWRELQGWKFDLGKLTSIPLRMTDYFTDHPQGREYEPMIRNVHMESAKLYNAMVETGINLEQAEEVLTQRLSRSYSFVDMSSLETYHRVCSLDAPHDLAPHVRDLERMLKEMFPVEWAKLSE